jgi:enoyl-CoA hydratase
MPSRLAAVNRPRANAGCAAAPAPLPSGKTLPCRQRARALLLTGDPFSPQRALEIGPVNSVVPRDALLPAARDLAAVIIRHSPLAVGGVITAVTRGLNMTIGEGLQVERAQFAALVPAVGEGINAWIERRPPAYAGR